MHTIYTPIYIYVHPLLRSSYVHKLTHTYKTEHNNCIQNTGSTAAGISPAPLADHWECFKLHAERLKLSCEDEKIYEIKYYGYSLIAFKRPAACHFRFTSATFYCTATALTPLYFWLCFCFSLCLCLCFCFFCL